MATRKRGRPDKLRGQKAKTQSLDDVVQQTFHLWRKHHLGYDQTKYVVERVRRRLALEPPRLRTRTVARLEYSEVERLIQVTYRSQSKYALMIKTLFLSGARVDEFVHIRVEDLLVDGDPPQIHLTHAKRGADRYVPILPALADELRTHLQGRQRGFLFESNRAYALCHPHGPSDRHSVRPHRWHHETRLSAPPPAFHRDHPAGFRACPD
jgi:integrase/recombinase XerD